jgi:hypothetical protein
MVSRREQVGELAAGLLQAAHERGGLLGVHVRRLAVKRGKGHPAAATDLVIASPVYWHSVSWLTKRYLDHWSGWQRTPSVNFKATLADRNL